MKQSSLRSADYRQTMAACFVGYIVQAIVNNFAPPPFRFCCLGDCFSIRDLPGKKHGKEGAVTYRFYFAKLVHIL